jgi:multiple sugar transport system substrate-binding protein
MFAFTACDTGTPEPAQPDAPPAETPADPPDEGDAEDPPEDPPQAEEGPLTVWTWKVAMVPAFEAAGEIFTERTGIPVEVQAFSPDDTYRQRVIAAANSGDLPDVIHWWGERGSGFENVLVNMNDFANDPAFMAQFSATAFDQSIVRASDVENWANDPETSEVVLALNEGDLYQIPLDMGGFFTIFGNNAILSEIGLEDTVPEDIFEFIDFAERASNETDYAGFIWAAGLPDVYYNWMGRAIEQMFLGPEVAQGIIDREELMSDPHNIQPLLVFEEMVNRGIFLDGIVTMDIDAGDMAFGAGLAAYLLGGTFTFGQLDAMGMNLDDIFTFVVPVMPGGAVPGDFHINGFTLTGLSISQTSPRQEAAMDFIQLITLDPDAIVAFYNAALLLPVANLDAATIERLDPAVRDMYNSLSDEPNVTTIVENMPGRDRGGVVYDEFYTDFQRMITGELTAQQVAENFDANQAAQEAAGH